MNLSTTTKLKIAGGIVVVLFIIIGAYLIFDSVSGIFGGFFDFFGGGMISDIVKNPNKIIDTIPTVTDISNIKGSDIISKPDILKDKKNCDKKCEKKCRKQLKCGKLFK